MDCQSGCTLKSVNFACLPEANLDSARPAQGSASMWALMEGRRDPHDENSQRFAAGRVVSRYARLSFSSVARRPDVEWMRMRNKSGSSNLSPTLICRSPSALSHQ